VVVPQGTHLAAEETGNSGVDHLGVGMGDLLVEGRGGRLGEEVRRAHRGRGLACPGRWVLGDVLVCGRSGMEKREGETNEESFLVVGQAFLGRVVVGRLLQIIGKRVDRKEGEGEQTARKAKRWRHHRLDTGILTQHWVGR